MTYDTLTVGLGERSYPIFIGHGLLGGDEAPWAGHVAGKRLLILHDGAVEHIVCDFSSQAMAAGAKDCARLALPSGEATKSFAQYEAALNWVLSRQPDRQTLIVAVGGGVCGDLTGFVAATALRGLPFLQVPTTLLSQVDSSVGGKTGINTVHGKNLVGAFHQPVAVIIDPETLQSLPGREVRAGYAEIVKYGLIDRPDFFGWLVENGDAVLQSEPDALRYAILESCRAKAEIVGLDERESGARALLNLGHTFGHALERACGYDGALLHGEAVAVGMVLAFQVSVAAGLCPAADCNAVIGHLRQAGLPTRIADVSLPADTTLGELMTAMHGDKKVQDGKIRFILARGIGRSFQTADIAPALIEQVMRDSMRKI